MQYKLILDPTAEETVLVTAHAPSPLTDQIETLVREYAGGGFLMGVREDEMRKLAFEEIECITIVNRKVIAIDTDGRHYRIQRRLYELETQLPSRFVRINKSTIANEDRILRFETAFSGGVDAVFRCGYRDYVSRRCFAEMKRRYGI